MLDLVEYSFVFDYLFFTTEAEGHIFPRVHAVVVDRPEVAHRDEQLE